MVNWTARDGGGRGICAVLLSDRDQLRKVNINIYFLNRYTDRKNLLNGASKHTISGRFNNAFPILARRDWPLLSMLTGISIRFSSSRSRTTCSINAFSGSFSRIYASSTLSPVIPLRYCASVKSVTSTRLSYRAERYAPPNARRSTSKPM